ncbi:uncharacterized protein (DUF58 family) [Pseudarthrobacter sp. PvP004]|uniref:DUF58 domain-containing protein n=1 Tax=Paenarthrobacter aurescens (strain TC1) TaxID=290340 RepID=A1R772_PAEAT|nr:MULTISPECIES: DUF58 domain-containing protein [Micrococcaceae]ABM08237.1 conserved hypothetical protein [Paenarthrobacter aurescens TC1]MBP2265537.1 uncharacterized protein (DUF58 family) [Pseudarthrobacter sp. PvP004]
MPSLLRRVKSKMFIFAHRRTLTLLDGEYGSVFKGRSLDFDELRAYVPGDEVRDIDWKATARHGSPLVKRYVAVRRHTVLLLVDTGRNMAAQALSGESKKDIAVHAAGVLGYLASRHGDDVGLLHGNAEASKYVPPRSGEEHLERLLREVDASAALDGPASGIAEQLDYVLRYLKGRLLIVAVADEFLPDARTESLMRRLRARHEVLWLTVRDAELAAEPGSRLQDSIDVGTGQTIPLPLAVDAKVRAAYAAAMLERGQLRRNVFHRLGIAEEHATGSADVLTAVFALLEKHRSGSFTSRSSSKGGTRAG